MTPNLNSLFGSILIGVYLNLFLLGIEIFLLERYWSRKEARKDDGVFLLSVVGFAFFNDFVGSSAECAIAYRYLITYSGDMAAVATLKNWPLTIYFISNAVSGIIVQSWMIWRYYRMSKRAIPSVVLAIIAFLPFTVQIIVAGLSVSQPNSSNYDRRIFVILTVVGLPVVDLGISIALVWELWRVQPVFRSTKYLVRKLSAIAIQTGVVMFIVVLASGIMYLAKPNTNLSGAASFIHGRIYTCTMLFSLNCREQLRDGAHDVVMSMPTFLTSPSTACTPRKCNSDKETGSTLPEFPSAARFIETDECLSSKPSRRESH